MTQAISFSVGKFGDYGAMTSALEAVYLYNVMFMCHLCCWCECVSSNALFNVECKWWWWVGVHTNMGSVCMASVCLCQLCSRYHHFYNIWIRQEKPAYVYPADDLASYEESDTFQQFALAMDAGATNEATQSSMIIAAMRHMKPQLPRTP